MTYNTATAAAATELKNELRATGLIPVFEYPVKNKITGGEDYIIFNIEVGEDEIKASHEPLTEAQSKSRLIAFESVEIEEGESLDYHLQGLAEACQMAIFDSDFFELSE